MSPAEQPAGTPWPERLEPEADGGAWIDHLARYRFCAARIPPGARVIEIGCGSGYGAAHLAARQLRVVALDRHLPSLAAATTRYRRAGLAYVAGDAMELPFRDQAVSAVVAFEIIEHLPQPGRLVREIARILAPGGKAWISTPNIARHYEKIRVRNPYHLVDYDLEGFRRELEAVFPRVEIYGQCPTWDVGRSCASRAASWRRKLSLLLHHPRALGAASVGKALHLLRPGRELPAWTAFILIDRELLEEAKVFVAECGK
jgi:SAM-dependent methyltransferase